ncbi:MULTISPECIES: RnfABCDGE type electron transport complex subunit G [unclassified Anaerobiospirillum]|uniref:RnfABCDGE type electron transport complex subunit G n=1 Tax=unclassified Anaerobiospirillum TaxID=2647410 RepID=UPI001FF2BB77|nr:MULTISPECIES: RnfABCDGE type electron transport complex subunit G [unclassified Anaerobiospirillum]MCK0535049.1 RnfABCDGE type electron transport complex subunit G [Anaerobiospirillum sp. NML120511]MCK0540174.1 RnfABCDGE type electron transport complex subunit G [Anaerobiospirillum sp. NML02-A-032]
MFDNKPGVRALFSGVILSAIAALCTAGVLYAEQDTSPHIQANRDRNEQMLIDSLLPDVKKQAQGKVTYHCKLISDRRIGKNMKAYIARDESGKTLGYISSFSTNRGYSVPLILIGGMDSNGRITRIDIQLSRETPGIGDKVERRRGNYLDQFDGLAVEDRRWDVKKFGGDFDYITGATVTSRALVLASKDFIEVIKATDFDSLRDCPK